jgi:hypothetical protein
MVDSSSSSGSGLERIDVSKGGEVEAWAKKLDVSATQIRDAVSAVGDRAEEVEMHLKGSRSTTNADQEKRGDGASGAG